MATTFFLTDTASDLTTSGDLDLVFGVGAYITKKLALTRGSGVTSITNVTATSSGVWGTWKDATPKTLVYITNPLNAFTMVGTANSATLNIRALENNAMANSTVGVSARQYSSSGTFINNIYLTQSSGVELGTTETVMSRTSTPNALSFASGDRIVLEMHWISATGVTAASGFTVTGFYSGTASGASGDSFTSFTETITEKTPASLLVPTTTPTRFLM